MQAFFVLSWLLHFAASPNLPSDAHSFAPIPLAAQNISADSSETAAVESLGVVVFFDKKKGFGVIKPGSSDKTIAVHASETSQTIKANDQVTYIVSKDKKKGERATQVKVKRP